MAYASTSSRSIARRRMRNARVEEQRTAHWYIYHALRRLATRMPWGPWKDIAYRIYAHPTVIKLVYLNGKLVARKCVGRNNLDRTVVVLKPIEPKPSSPNAIPS